MYVLMYMHAYVYNLLDYFELSNKGACVYYS